MYSFVPLNNQTVYERFTECLLAFIIGFPILCFILSLGFSMIPYRGLSFGKKYVRTTLLTLYIIHIIMFAMMVIDLLFILFLFK